MFRDYFGAWRSAEETNHTLLVYHIVLVHQEVLLTSALLQTSHQQTSVPKLMESSVVIMKNWAFKGSFKAQNFNYKD